MSNVHFSDANQKLYDWLIGLSSPSIKINDSYAVESASAPANSQFIPIGGKDDSAKYRIAAIDILSADTRNAARNALMVFAVGGAFNGTTLDRWRNNLQGTLLASAARTATTNSSDQTNYNGRGLHIILDVTALTGDPSITLKIEGKDAASGKYYTLLESAAVTAIGTTVYRIYPGLTIAANATANDILPRTWRVTVTHANTDSITYSAGYAVIL